MPTFTQALLLGTERIGTAPLPPHPALNEAWSQFDWAGAKETAVLDAAALVGIARSAGAVAIKVERETEAAPTETKPYAAPRAVAILRRLFAEEWRALLPEWMELGVKQGSIVPPFFLRTLFHLAGNAAERDLVRQVSGERGRWLARQNPEWSWITGGAPAASLDPSVWETGTTDERAGWFRRMRQSAPAEARQQLEKTWADEVPDFRTQALEMMRIGLSMVDESFLTKALKDRRKEVRVVAQALLASLPQAGLTERMRTRAETLLTCQRSFLSKKLEVTLPAAFDPAWAADAIEEKAPAGVGEKAFWTQQILAVVPVQYWVTKFGVDLAKLIDLANKSGDWADLLFGAWYRSACLHRDPEACAALLRPILVRQKPPVAGISALPAATTLLANCDEAERWRMVADVPEIAWAALPLLTGLAKPAEGRALFDHLATALRDGFNPGGSPTAVLAARRLPPSLYGEAAKRLARDNGLSKPAEAFLQALELRAEMHKSFSQPPPP
ncbi:MAG: DUF5691 domain-containing protein [Lacunisphaera sp.]